MNLEELLIDGLLVREPLLDLGHIRIGVIKLRRGLRFVASCPRRLSGSASSRRAMLSGVAHLDLVSRRQERVEAEDEPLVPCNTGLGFRV